MNNSIRISYYAQHQLSHLPHPDQHSKTAKLLVGMVIPGSVIFLLVIRALNAGHTTTSAMFFVGYLICAVLQVSVRECVCVCVCACVCVHECVCVCACVCVCV